MGRRPEAPRDEEKDASRATAETETPEAPRDEEAHVVHASSGVKFTNPHINLHTRLHNA